MTTAAVVRLPYDFAWEGAGNDPVAFYSEAEPKVRGVAERLKADTATTWQIAQEAFRAYVGDRRLDADWNAFASEHPTPEGRDTALWLIEVAAKEWPKSDDVRCRLYHRGAPRTLALAIGLRPPARER